MRKIFLFLTVSFLSVVLFAKTVTLTWGDGQTVSIDLPEDIATLIEDNKDIIEEAFEDNDITADDVNDALDDGALAELKEFYEEQGTDFSPYTDVKEGIRDFGSSFGATLANAQHTQSVWAEAWIGQFVPKGFHIGGGLNVGVAELKLGPLVNVFVNVFATLNDKPEDDVKIPGSFVFPSIAGDLRIGGIYLPFDLGISLMVFDTSKIDALSDIPFGLDYFTLGIDGRWALMTGEAYYPKISVGAGFAYTSASVFVNDTDISADVGISTMNFYAQAQISKKLLFFIPFAGLKMGVSVSTGSWEVTPNWSGLFDIKNDDIGGYTLEELNIFPETIGDSYTSVKFVPQIYGGFGLDFFVVNLTFAGGYDIMNRIYSLSVNFRIAW